MSAGPGRAFTVVVTIADQEHADEVRAYLPLLHRSTPFPSHYPHPFPREATTPDPPLRPLPGGGGFPRSIRVPVSATHSRRRWTMKGHLTRFARVWLLVSVALAGLLANPAAAAAAMVGNPACPGEEVLFDPGNGEDIVVPEGYKVEVFAKGLNFPTAIAFMGDKAQFQVFVLESGRGLPSRCNDNEDP